MSFKEDPRLVDAKGKSVLEILGLLKIAGLRQTPNKRELTGPCPVCGTAGHNPKSGPADRFNINLASGAFFCRQCDLRGGDVISLVREVEGLSFPDALTRICGDRPENETEEQKAEREQRQKEVRERLERKAEEQDKIAEQQRAKAKRDARKIWKRAGPGDEGPHLRGYLQARGLGRVCAGPFPRELRFIQDHPYVKKIDGRLRVLHRGPCMIAAIQNAEGQGTAVHQTWIDPARPGMKALIFWGKKLMKAKLVRGSKKGGAIRLITPPDASILVMGEGIETTLSAYAADAVPGAAYWAGIDLGNMAGKMKRVDGKRWSGVPDLDDLDAFVPPEWVKQLIYLQDGDSNPTMTRAKLLAGLKRAMALRPGLSGQIVHPGKGVDLNDLLIGKLEQEVQDD